jgi:methylthioribose-1-phosphate isomerase
MRALLQLRVTVQLSAWFVLRLKKGKRVAVLADETRPFLQGARLTAWELNKEGIPSL